jgi:hypothetical protein
MDVDKRGESVGVDTHKNGDLECIWVSGVIKRDDNIRCGQALKEW